MFQGLEALFLVSFLVCTNCSVAWAVIHHGCDTMAVMNWSQSYTHFGPFSIKWDGPTLEIALLLSSANAFPSCRLDPLLQTIESTAITSNTFRRIAVLLFVFMGISHVIQLCITIAYNVRFWPRDGVLISRTPMYLVHWYKSSMHFMTNLSCIKNKLFLYLVFFEILSFLRLN